MTAIEVSRVTMLTANGADRATGVIGFVTATINGLVIDGITVRRSLAGELVLGFPCKTDKYGIKRPVVRPTDDGVRREVTEAVLAALGLTSPASTSPAAQGESPAGPAP